MRIFYKGDDNVERIHCQRIADLIGKHEETIKCWIRAGKLPNS